jgi:N,N'-diacetyllegionaminate synthase
MTPHSHIHWLNNPVPGAACAVIAEIAQAHDGSLGMAHAFIDCAATTGVAAVKFQTHIAAAESTAHEPWRAKFSRQDATRYDYWKRMEFSADQWAGLKSHAAEKGLIFLSSPFSQHAVELLRKLDIAAWKVASGELTNLPMLADMARDGKPMMLSTGMSDFAEIDAAVQLVKGKAPFAIFQCTTQYPSPPEAIGLNVIGELRQRHGCAAGLSDHSGTIYPSLAAAALHQVEIIEVHLTLSRDMFGPDVVASVTPDELSSIVKGVDFIQRMRAADVDKTSLDQNQRAMRGIFLKSVVAGIDLAPGAVLSEQNLALKKPGNGIPAADLAKLIGRTLNKPVRKDEPIQFSDIEAS